MRKFSLQNLLPADFQFSGDIQSELGKVVQQSFPINQVKDPRPRILVPRKVLLPKFLMLKNFIKIQICSRRWCWDFKKIFYPVWPLTVELILPQLGIHILNFLIITDLPPSRGLWLRTINVKVNKRWNGNHIKKPCTWWDSNPQPPVGRLFQPLDHKVGGESKRKRVGFEPATSRLVDEPL